MWKAPSKIYLKPPLMHQRPLPIQLQVAPLLDHRTHSALFPVPRVALDMDLVLAGGNKLFKKDGISVNFTTILNASLSMLPTQQVHSWQMLLRH